MLEASLTLVNPSAVSTSSTAFFFLCRLTVSLGQFFGIQSSLFPNFQNKIAKINGINIIKSHARDSLSGVIDSAQFDVILNCAPRRVPPVGNESFVSLLFDQFHKLFLGWGDTAFFVFQFQGQAVVTAA